MTSTLCLCVHVAAQGQTDRGVHPYNYCLCVFVYMELSTVLTRGIEQASTETRARGEQSDLSHRHHSNSKEERLLSAAGWLLHVGDNIC